MFLQIRVNKKYFPITILPPIFKGMFPLLLRVGSYAHKMNINFQNN